ncbi:hypothetical protein LCGC14_0620100 [marine sediment metagenome]|uniref:Uncharacterized protein n=1 Tax=marine sediment metagenome TaxID=412755 RepID=A0A0F9UDL3_9ZZZZ
MSPQVGHIASIVLNEGEYVHWSASVCLQVLSLLYIMLNTESLNVLLKSTSTTITLSTFSNS